MGKRKGFLWEKGRGSYGKKEGVLMGKLYTRQYNLVKRFAKKDGTIFCTFFAGVPVVFSRYTNGVPPALFCRRFSRFALTKRGAA